MSGQRMTAFNDFIKEIEEEAKAEGPEAVAELEALRSHYALARQLIELRQSHKMTQTQLAKQSGIPQSEISRIERGSANPTVATLNALVKSLNADLQLVHRDAA